MKYLKLSLIALVISGTATLFLHGTASALNSAHQLDNTLPGDATSGDTTVMLVNGKTNYVTNMDTTVRVWFSSRSGGTVTIKNGNFCNSNAADVIQSGDSASWGNGNGNHVTKFHMYATGKDYGTHYGVKNTQCGNDITFSITNLPDNPENSYYHADLDVDYVASDNGVSNYGVMNYFTIKSSGTSFIGQPGDGRASDSGYGVTEEQTDTSPANPNYVVPFGAQCTGSNQTARINFFDLDTGSNNGGAQKNGNITVTLSDTTSGSTGSVKFTAKDNGSFNGNNTTWTPGGSSNTKTWVEFTAKPAHKYKLYINNVFYNNTIQYSVPYSQILSKSCNTQPPPSDDRYVTVSPQATGGTDTAEVGASMTFQQSADVSNFPGQGSWGFVEDGTRNAVSAGVNYTKNDYAAEEVHDGAYDSVPRCGDDSFHNDCSGNKSSGHPKGSGDNGKLYHCAAKYDDSCGNYVLTCNGYSGTWTYSAADDPTVPAACNRSQYYCKDSNGNWKSSSDWTGHRNETHMCNNRWVCPDPSVQPNQFGGDHSGDSCRIIQCAVVSDDVTNGINSGNANSSTWSEASKKQMGISGSDNQDNHNGACYKRCSGGYVSSTGYYNGSSNFSDAGAVGYGQQPPNISSGDDHCYVHPHFQLRCIWDNGAATPWQSVASNGTYCTGQTNSSTTRTGTVMGHMCVVTRPDVNGNTPYSASSVGSGAWVGINPGRGTGSSFNDYRTNWFILVNPATDDACGDFGTKPYMKAYGGNVESGSYITYNTGTGTASCGTNTDDRAGTIRAWNQGTGSYLGSGTNGGVVAAGNITGFRSTNAQTTLSQRGLTFANNNGATYGGNFGAFDYQCNDYTQAIKNATSYTSGTLGATTISGNGYQPVTTPSGPDSTPVMKAITNPTVAQGGTFVHTGDLYITGNATYNTAAVNNVALLPHFKMIVLGNIYIASTVTQLDGEYVAVDTGATGTGNIVDCATTSATPGVARMLDDDEIPVYCANKLTVNGSLTARSVKYFRVGPSSGGVPSGTVSKATATETPATTNASEVINYTPQSWLPRGAIITNIGNPYDSMTGLPPVL